MADLGDVLVHLVTGKLAALTRLCALRHLDLDIVGVHQIFGGDSETPRRHLLDRRTHGIAIGQRLEAVWLLAPLARVGAAADTVHGERERGVRFPADRKSTRLNSSP